MRIALYSPTWPASDAQNGVVTYVDILTRALQRAGHEVIVLTRVLRRIDDPSIEVREIAYPGKMNSYASLKARLGAMTMGAKAQYRRAYAARIAEVLNAANAEKPIDVFEIEEAFGFVSLLKERTSVPIVMRMHGPHFLGHTGEFEKHDMARVANEGASLLVADGITSPSPGLLAEVKSRYQLSRDDAAVIANPVEFPDDAARWQWETCDQNLLLFVGRFDLRKGADVMLNAFCTLVDKHPSLKLVMAGKDIGIPDETGAMKKFDAYAKANLPDETRARIEYLGPIGRDELDELRRRACVYISASRFECCAYAVMETMAMGTPVVASSTFGAHEFPECENALAVSPVGDGDALAGLIDRLVSDPDELKRMGAAGFEAASYVFSPDRLAEQSIEYYRQCL